MEFEWLSRIGNKLLLYDVFSGAGGAAYGYQQVGFFVVGIDNKPQKNYIGDAFYQMDALEFLGQVAKGLWPEPVAIHTSPPCQFGSKETPMAYRQNHKNYIPEVRGLLLKIGKPYVIENVENVRSHLINPIKLCGSMFGLNIWRHRYFEIWPDIFPLTPPCNHSQLPVLITGTTRRKNGGRFEYTVQECRDAGELQWMTRDELDEAIPPRFTKFIGEQLLTALIAPTR